MNVDDGMSQSTTNVRITCIAMRVCHTLTKKILEAYYSDDGASERGRIKGGFTLSSPLLHICPIVKLFYCIFYLVTGTVE